MKLGRKGRKTKTRRHAEPVDWRVRLSVSCHENDSRHSVPELLTNTDSGDGRMDGWIQILGWWDDGCIVTIAVPKERGRTDPVVEIEILI